MTHICAVAIDSGYNSHAASDAEGLFAYARGLDGDAELFLLRPDHSRAALPDAGMDFTVLEVNCGGAFDPQKTGELLSRNLPREPALWLFGPDGTGKQTAMFFAVMRKLPAAANITGVRLCGETVKLKRMAYEGRLAAGLQLPSEAVVALAKGVSGRAEHKSKKGNTDFRRLEDIPAPEDLEIYFEQTENPLLKAKKVVAVGRGVASRADMQRIEETAGKFGAELAVSRPIATNGWKPVSRQLGISGQVITPDVCLLVCVSGTPAIMYGVRGANNLLAVNSDGGAPVFDGVQSGTAADWTEVFAELEKLAGKE